MGNIFARGEIRVLKMRNLILREQLAHVNRRLDDLKLWRSNVIVRERAIIERLTEII